MSQQQKCAVFLAMAAVIVVVFAVPSLARAVGPTVPRGGALVGGSTSSTAAVEPTSSVEPTPTPEDTRPVAPSFVPKKGRAIWVDRKHQRVSLYVDGRRVDVFPCSTARTLPRNGTYRVYAHTYHSYSIDGTMSFYYFSVFTRGPHGNRIGFHSLPTWVRNGKPVAPLGRPVSHGCVRCPPAKAKFIYGWATKSTVIVVRS
jgi:lipoprotein-anchoring transpeptidase ErfK/SrfK